MLRHCCTHTETRLRMAAMLLGIEPDNRFCPRLLFVLTMTITPRW